MKTGAFARVLSLLAIARSRGVGQSATPRRHAFPRVPEERRVARELRRSRGGRRSCRLLDADRTSRPATGEPPLQLVNIPSDRVDWARTTDTPSQRGRRTISSTRASGRLRQALERGGAGPERDRDDTGPGQASRDRRGGAEEAGRVAGRLTTTTTTRKSQQLLRDSGRGHCRPPGRRAVSRAST